MKKEEAAQNALAAFEKLCPVLAEDTKEAITLADNEQNSKTYRNAYRTVFAEIEGLIFAMRQLVIRDTIGSRVCHLSSKRVGPTQLID